MGNYFINKKYYATVLCINKENKNLDCEGNCQLTKELKSVETSHTNDSPQAPKELGAEIWPFIFQECESFSPPQSANFLAGIKFNPLKINRLSFPIFHPPEFRVAIISIIKHSFNYLSWL